MWLININTGRLEAFNDDSKKRPDYAILSHTWGSDDEELSFQDLQASEPKTGPGRDKFEACCTLAKWDQLEYAWIDTCCIDKTSSTELSEAINSMFKWYRDAKICYAYLSDVAESTPAEPESDFGRSRWFQRGWTLQELIAPPIVRFFNAEWKYLGDKATLATVVEQITQIPRLVLLGHIQLKEASIAQRMSWAANRVTKRKEDIAYCLLGIFDVMMPMLYGEGERAFIRLQEAILLSQPNDDSILAWGNIPRSSRSVTFPTGAFASAPSDFLRCGQVICTTSSDSDDANVLTLQGRSVRLRRPLYAHPSSQLYIVLRCRFYDEPERCIALSVQPWSSGVNNYCRDGKRSVISVRKRDLTAQNENVRIMIDQSYSGGENERQNAFYIENAMDSALKLVDVCPSSCWDSKGPMIFPNQESKIGRFDRIWVMLAPISPRASLNLIVLLERMWRGSVPYVQHYVMSCSSHISLDAIQRDLHLASDSESLYKMVDEEEVVSNGSVHMRLAVRYSRVGAHDMFVVRIRPSEKTGSFHDSTEELQRLALERQVIGSFQQYHEAALDTGNRDLILDPQKPQVDSLSARLGSVRAQIQTLLQEQGELEKAASEIAITKAFPVTEYEARQNTQSTLWEKATKLQRQLYDTNPKARTHTQSARSFNTAFLFHSALKGVEWPFQYLARLDINVNIPFADNQSLIAAAARGGNRRILRTVLCLRATTHGDSLSPALDEACRGGHVHIVSMLLNHDFNSTNLPSKKDASTHFDKALEIAVKTRRTEIAECLLKYGAPVDGQCYGDRRTVLMIAASLGSKEIVQLLLDVGAHIDKVDIYGSTALMYAAVHNESNCVSYLLERGADATIRDKKRKAAIDYGKIKGHSEIVQILQNWDPSQNKRDQDQNEPLERTRIRENGRVQGNPVTHEPTGRSRTRNFFSSKQ